MCAPDLLGTQGTFLFFTTRPSEQRFKEGGIRIQLGHNGTEDRFETAIQGPENSLVEGNQPMEIPLTIEVDRAGRAADVRIDGKPHRLQWKVLSDHIPLTFKAGLGVKAQGICRMMVTEMDEHFSLYVSPINIDPDKPSMPISHPSYYAPYLSNTIGHFCTLGLAEDTWALNEGVTDDATFLQQTYDIDKEREEMFFRGLSRLKRGSRLKRVSLVCVFDGTDRIQHMFWR
jgi:hypothetical protein